MIIELCFIISNTNMSEINKFFDALLELGVVDRSGMICSSFDAAALETSTKILSLKPQDGQHYCRILTGGLLSLQTENSHLAHRMTAVVVPIIFYFISSEHENVRIVADETMNHFIKCSRFQLRYNILSELLYELKRLRNSRSIICSLRKFSLLVPQIKPQKRRVYLKFLLPLLRSLIQYTDEHLLLVLTESLPAIASNLFPYANSADLNSFFDAVYDRLGHESVAVKRNLAKLLSICCTHHSRAAETLTHYLGRLVQTLQSHALEGGMEDLSGYFIALKLLARAAAQRVSAECETSIALATVAALHFGDLALSQPSLLTLCTSALEALKECLAVLPQTLTLDTHFRQFYSSQLAKPKSLQVFTAEANETEGMDDDGTMPMLPLGHFPGVSVSSNLDTNSIAGSITEAPTEEEEDEDQLLEQLRRKAQETRRQSNEQESVSSIENVLELEVDDAPQVVAVNEGVKTLPDWLQAGENFDEALMAFVLHRFQLVSVSGDEAVPGKLKVRVSTKLLAFQALKCLVARGQALLLLRSLTLVDDQRAGFAVAKADQDTVFSHLLPLLNDSDPHVRSVVSQLLGVMLQRFCLLDCQPSADIVPCFQRVLSHFQSIFRNLVSSN
ncbi:Snail 2 [Cichlidogyrus casuarinus]|uniref:Snail 2 n=1 Tax=Cichlidogyrus casuarinus TaxID=1844966 RepID=A0ABD2Q7B1_9PLAT